ncbi:MAG: polysaccharide pyruvyl transferase family protein, partial [Acidimicrobiales bacterium]
MSGQGIGPLDERSRALASVVLEGAVRGSVRDAGSVGWWPASITAAAAAEVQVTGDDALMLAAADEATVSAALRRAGVDGAYLAVSVRRADYVGTSAEQLDGWADAVDHLAADRGLIVLGVALNHHPEHPEVVTLAGLARGAQARRARWRVLECASDPGLLAGVMSGAAAAVVHSYHAALFALRAGVPALLVASNEYYEQKAKGLADLAGLPDAFVLPRAVDRDDLATRLD